jgi:hypothetical protein
MNNNILVGCSESLLLLSLRFLFLNKEEDDDDDDDDTAVVVMTADFEMSRTYAAAVTVIQQHNIAANK